MNKKMNVHQFLGKLTGDILSACFEGFLVAFAINHLLRREMMFTDVLCVIVLIGSIRFKKKEG